MKSSTSKTSKFQDMASEYHFDYSKAKPNRFVDKMNLNVGWTVEKFAEEEKEVKKPVKAKAKVPPKKAKPAAKAKPAKKKASPKGKKKK